MAEMSEAEMKAAAAKAQAVSRPSMSSPPPPGAAGTTPPGAVNAAGSPQATAAGGGSRPGTSSGIPPETTTASTSGATDGGGKKKRKKKELTPEEIQAALEEERRLIKSFYLRKWEETKKKSTLFNTYMDEGFPAAEFQPPLTVTEVLPILNAIANTPLMPFQKAMDALMMHPWFRKEDIKRYTAAALRYADFLVQKNSGPGGAANANIPVLPGMQPRKRNEIRSRLVIEYLMNKSADKNTLLPAPVENTDDNMSVNEGQNTLPPAPSGLSTGAPTSQPSAAPNAPPPTTPPLTIESTDEVGVLNVWVVEWLPYRDVIKIDKPKDKGEFIYFTCTNAKCEQKYILKLYYKCGACGAKYCSYECQREDWNAHHLEFKCNGTLSRGINTELKKLQQGGNIRRLNPMLPYIKLLTWTFSKLTCVDGYFWYAMAYLKDADWKAYAKLTPKDKDDKKSKSSSEGGGGGGDTFSWACYTPCCTSRGKAEATFSKREVARTPRILFEMKLIEGYRIGQYLDPNDQGGVPLNTGGGGPMDAGVNERDLEVILPCGATFRVMQSTTTGTLLHLVCEQIPQPYSAADLAAAAAAAAASEEE